MEHPHQFEIRHLGNDQAAMDLMLDTIGVKSLAALIDQTIPDSIRMRSDLDLPDAMDEFQYLRHIKGIAAQNKVFRSYIGQGFYGTHTPSPILRNVFQNPGWYTQYTPYQAEIAQGRLEALFNYQTMVADLTGLPIANASLLDEGTAAAEAMILFYNQASKAHSSKHIFLVDDMVHVHTIDVLKTRAKYLNIELKIESISINSLSDPSIFGLLLQYPDTQGKVSDYTDLCSKAHDQGILIAAATDLLALTVLTPPGEWGADVAVGNAQRFGVPMGYGGPHAAFFSCKEEFKRLIPGRIIGLSIDQYDAPAYRMALQTREQHIKREKATSNICTAQALLAIMSGMYAVYYGPAGLKTLGAKVYKTTCLLAQSLTLAGYQIKHSSFFDTLTLEISTDDAQPIKARAIAKGINFYYTTDTIQIALDETVTEIDLYDILEIFEIADLAKDTGKFGIQEVLLRQSPYLSHPVFNTHRSETAMMRYIKSLENKDISLVHSMIALGSCTMKLNAATELLPVSLEGFSTMHPFAPLDQTQGYQYIFNKLEQWLCSITGMKACSLQPNSGAQGEYAGLLSIAAYHEYHRQKHRNIALIPESAHGTNPASAVMAGMRVVVTKTDEKGNIDLADLTQLAEKHANELACLMVTYPSTHGVFETKIKEICKIIHDHGGLVYMDGANMNAQVGLTSPGLIHADVCHLNLHKTFAIPHGGGGPGMGPICVNEKLAPFLPGHSMVNLGGPQAIHAVSSSPWGSASILLISYGYILMLGKIGVRHATEHAILNANYMKALLQESFQVLYSGEQGRAAHELILDLRPFKGIGITAEDVAKRLMDYGFHAPTVSFPVAGTIMIEPTESENKEELDKFCAALLQIKIEIDEIAKGEADPVDNVLKNAPHTNQLVTADLWDKSYSRSKAAFPLDYLRHHKMWPMVARVNNAYGDRNLVCTCPPVASYNTEA